MPEQSFSEVLQLAHLPSESTTPFNNIILPFTLRPHQVLGVQCGLYWDRFGLYHDVRTGKTIVMQLLALFYANYRMRSTFLLPPILFDQFVDEYARIKGHNLKITLIEGDAKRKIDMLQSFALSPSEAPDIVVTTSQIFSGPFGKKRKEVVMQNWQYFAKFTDCLFFDECHLGLQDEESLTFRAIESYLKYSPTKRLVMSSGTPFRTELKSAYPSIRLKTPELYTSRRHFDAIHVNYVPMVVKFNTPRGVGERRITKVDSYKEIETLTQNFYQKSHRVSKFDVLKFADPNVQVVPIHLSKPHLKLYKQLVTEQLLEAGEELLDFREQSKLRHFALRIITAPEIAGQDVEIKENMVIKGIETIADTANVSDGGKLIVFANYNSSVKYLRDRLSKYTPAVIYGGDDSSSELNRKEVARFKKTTTCNVAIINPQAGGVGLTLGDVCQYAVFAEPVSSPGLFEQAAARILLDGQTAPSSVYIFDVKNTWSSEAVKRLLDKEEEVQDVMRDKKTLLKQLLCA